MPCLQYNAMLNAVNAATRVERQNRDSTFLKLFLFSIDASTSRILTWSLNWTVHRASLLLTALLRSSLYSINYLLLRYSQPYSDSQSKNHCLLARVIHDLPYTREWEYCCVVRGPRGLTTKCCRFFKNYHWNFGKLFEIFSEPDSHHFSLYIDVKF